MLKRRFKYAEDPLFMYPHSRMVLYFHIILIHVIYAHDLGHLQETIIFST